MSLSRLFPPVPRMRACLLPVSIYLALACRHLALPGIYDDESLVGHVAQEIVRIVLSGRLLDLPTGIHPYHGIFSSLACLPLILAFPHAPVAALRLTFVLAGAATVVLLYRLAYHVVGRWQEALLAACLLAISPSFIIGMRIGAYAGGLQLPIEVASLYCLSLWLESGAGVHLALSMFLLGLGLSCSAQFVFSFAATAVLIACHLSIRSPRERARAILPGLGALFLGAANIIFHVGVGFRHFESFLRQRIAAEGSFFQPIEWSFQLARFRDLADGSAFPGRISEYRGAPDLGPRNPFFPWIVVAALFFLALSAVARRRDEREFPKALREGDLLAWQAVYFLTSGTFRFARLPIHIFAWLPLPQLCVALALSRWKPRAPRRSRAFFLAAAALLGANLFADAACLAGFDGYLARTGGQDRFSSAVYDLVAWLEAGRAEKVLVFSRPLQNNLWYLSRGRIDAVASYYPTGADAPRARRIGREAVAGRRRVDLVEYVIRQPGEDASAAVFLDEAAALGYSCAERRFADRESTPVFTAWRCAPRALASAR